MTQILSIPIIAQGDPRWKDRRLGFSDVSIGGYGCAIACLAMLGAYAQHEPPIPLDELNETLKSNDVYYAHNMLRWPFVETVYPSLLYVTRVDIGAQLATPAQLKLISDHLSRGVPVVIYVDSSKVQPGLQQHFVLVTGYDGARMTIQDPWHGDSAYLCPRYGKTMAEAVWGIVLYDLVEPPDMDLLDEARRVAARRRRRRSVMGDE